MLKQPNEESYRSEVTFKIKSLKFKHEKSSYEVVE